MRFSIDSGSSVAPFEQLRAQIVNAVASGKLIAGTKIPTVRTMAADLGLAPNTVAKAYRELEQDGVLETRGRSGSFIADSGDPSRTATQRAATEFVHLARRMGVSDTRAVEFVRTAQRELS
ncbi:GntR family transcriptional regulator [Actinomycetes bacterium M1A6_2h]